MKGPSQWLRPVHGSLLGLVVGLGVAFVLALGLGAGIAIVTQQGSLPLPEGAEPLQADATTTSIEAARREDAEISGPSEGAEEAPTGDHNVGVWYAEEDQRWTIFNQDLAPMAQGTSFDVHVLSDEEAFVHRATAENTAEDGTYLNDPLTNANPDVPLSVTQNWNPGGVVGGTYNDHPVGVRYDADVRQWVIFNEDGEEVPEGAAFNVTIYPLGEPTFVQRATSGNITQNWTSIDDPLVNGDPNAILIAIPRQREG